LNIKREIFPDYQCNCTKVWAGDDLLVIYKATAETIQKIHEASYTKDADQTVQTIAQLTAHHMSEKAIIAGAHTVVNLKDRFHISDEVFQSAKVALGLIRHLQEHHQKKAEFLVPINDLYMERDEKTDEGYENSFRKEALDPYIIPPRILFHQE